METGTVHEAEIQNCVCLNIRSARYLDASIMGTVTRTQKLKVRTYKDDDSEWIEVLEPYYGFTLKKYVKVIT